MAETVQVLTVVPLALVAVLLLDTVVRFVVAVAGSVVLVF